MTRPIRWLLGLVAVSCLAAPAAHADIPYWQFRGYVSGPFVRAIAIDPTNPDVVYVGVTNAGTPWGEYDNETGSGIAKSTDGGATWAPSDAGVTSQLVTAIVIDPTNPSVLYAGTDGQGAFKTTNAGTTWTPINTGLTDPDVYALAIAPTSPPTLYAGTDGSGIFLSVDGGASWTKATGPGAYPTIFAFAVDPSDPATVYAGIDGSVIRTTDGGATFTFTGKIGTSWGPEVRSLVVDASTSTVLAAGYGFDSGIWRSVDGGDHWTESSAGLLSEFGNNQHMTTLAQDALDPAVFYGSGIWENFRSIDGGHTWAKFATGLARENLPAIAVHAGGTVYTGSVFGEFHRLRVRSSGVNHYRCFKARAKGFVPQPLTITDRFGTQTTIAQKPFRYCTPTDPMGEGVVDPTSHLVCYKIDKGSFVKQWVLFLSQRIDGYRGYRVEKPETVCVPATVGVPAAAPRDVYRCIDGPHYRSGDLDFTISDAYGSQHIVRNKVRRLCAPADLDGAGENRIEDDVDLRCDSMLGKTPFTPTTVTTTDRFGTLTLRVLKPDTHCFPALETRD